MFQNPLEIHILIYYRINKSDCFAVLTAPLFLVFIYNFLKIESKLICEIPASSHKFLKCCIFLLCKRLWKILKDFVNAC